MPNNPDITFHAKQIFSSGSQTDIMLFYNRQYKLYQKVRKHHLQHQQSLAIRQKKFILLFLHQYVHIFFLILKSN